MGKERKKAWREGEAGEGNGGKGRRKEKESNGEEDVRTCMIDREATERAMGQPDRERERRELWREGQSVSLGQWWP